MKVLKSIGMILVIFILIVCILGLIAPRSYHVERNVFIEAPRSVVFSNVQYWNNWTKWSPWAEMDPEMKVTIQGVDGTEGSKYVWDGEEAGEGEMTNTGLKPGEQMTYHIQFLKPWKSESNGHMRVDDEGEGTKATWAFYGKTPFPFNIMGLFVSMDKMVGKDFERGLERLKELSEKQMLEMEK